MKSKERDSLFLEALSEDKAFRTIHESWWPQERWTEAEQAACIEKIQKQGTQFDYVLSHTGPTPGIACIDPYFSNEDNLAELALDSTVVFNDKIDSLVTYKKWFFGHFGAACLRWSRYCRSH